MLLEGRLLGVHRAVASSAAVLEHECEPFLIRGGVARWELPSQQGHGEVRVPSHVSCDTWPCTACPPPGGTVPLGRTSVCCV